MDVHQERLYYGPHEVLVQCRPAKDGEQLWLAVVVLADAALTTIRAKRAPFPTRDELLNFWARALRALCPGVDDDTPGVRHGFTRRLLGT